MKKLGSLLGDRDDIARRKQLASSSMKNVKKLWVGKKVSKKKKLILYNSLVKSILCYNSSTWGLSKKDEDGLNSFHRQQLRQILNIKYPEIIRSANLYKNTNTKPISIDITRARWKLLGHTLRMHKDTPARRAMKFFFEKENIKKFRGRKRSTIVTTINKDIKRTKKKYPNFDLNELNSELNLHNVRVKATNKKLWRKRVGLVESAAYSEKLKQL